MAAMRVAEAVDGWKLEGEDGDAILDGILDVCHRVPSSDSADSVTVAAVQQSGRTRVSTAGRIDHSGNVTSRMPYSPGSGVTPKPSRRARPSIAAFSAITVPRIVVRPAPRASPISRASR